MRKTFDHEPVRVWDLPTRLFHWMLVILVLTAWITSEYFEEIGDPRLLWHRCTGYSILTLLLWRSLWGVWGPPPALFKNFIRSPQILLQYIKDLIEGHPRHFLGHNPLGALMILMLLAGLIIISFLGLFTVEENDLATGALAYAISEEGNNLATKAHGFVFNSLLIWLIGFHILANTLYSLLKKEPLIQAMITGHKPQAIYEDREVLSFDRDYNKRAIFFLGISLSIVGLIVFVVGK